MSNPLDVIKVHVQRSQDAVRIDCSIYTLGATRIIKRNLHPKADA